MGNTKFVIFLFPFQWVRLDGLAPLSSSPSMSTQSHLRQFSWSFEMYYSPPTFLEKFPLFLMQRQRPLFSFSRLGSFEVDTHSFPCRRTKISSPPPITKRSYLTFPLRPFVKGGSYLPFPLPPLNRDHNGTFSPPPLAYELACCYLPLLSPLLFVCSFLPPLSPC